MVMYLVVTLKKHSDKYKNDPNSFIFSLINKTNIIDCDQIYGSAFGGNDFRIADKSNTNTTSYSNLGHSYTHPDYRFETNEAKSFLAGSYNFQVSEMEVYTKL